MDQRVTTLSRLAVLVFLSVSTAARGQVSFEEPPIDYLSAPLSDPVAELQKRIDEKTVELEFDEERGYLKSVLEHLGVSTESQVLVFTKTSFQLKRISPRSPRAVYFQDDVYVGWVRGGDVVEISAVDPRQGAVFYTLDQEETARPRFVRRTYECLQCHSSSLTRGVPGHLVRSVYPAPDGRPILKAGTFLTDHTSPLKERWGGWYVTGRHGAQRHLGNLLVRGADDPETVDTDAGANVTDLGGWFEGDDYLSPHSDIAALMVLEHQTQLHNLITRANFLTRITLNDEKVMNDMLERPADHRSESTLRRIASAAEPLVKYLLLSGEAQLTDPISGTSGFAAEFASRGPRDRRGRSLRELDLNTRLFRYPCSYLIYSEAFDELPAPVKDRVYQRLWEVLTGEDRTDDFAHLSPADRQAILEILRDTKPGLPAYWKPEASEDEPARKVPGRQVRL